MSEFRKNALASNKVLKYFIIYHSIVGSVRFCEILFNVKTLSEPCPHDNLSAFAPTGTSPVSAHLIFPSKKQRCSSQAMLVGGLWAGLTGSEISTHNFSCGDTNRRFNQPIYRFRAVKRLKPLPDDRLSKAPQLKLWVNKAEPISHRLLGQPPGRRLWHR
ncbi:MAG: hypothetical protein R2797_13695, partial [Gelidibacter sp.]